MKNDGWISFPVPGGGKAWTRCDSIISVTTITTLSLAQSKLAKEITRQEILSENPTMELPSVDESPGFRELKQAKAVVSYIPRWVDSDAAFLIYTTLDDDEAIRKIQAEEG